MSEKLRLSKEKILIPTFSVATLLAVIGSCSMLCGLYAKKETTGGTSYSLGQTIQLGEMYTPPSLRLSNGMYYEGENKLLILTGASNIILENNCILISWQILPLNPNRTNFFRLSNCTSAIINISK